MEIKKFLQNRKKFIDLSDSEDYNDLISRINFVKGQETALNFSKDEEDQDDR